MKKYWKNNEEMTRNETELVDALHKAQFSCAFRENASTVAFQIAAGATGSLSKGITAGLSTIGGKHAPIEDIYNFLQSNEPELGIVPGWGSSFCKGAPDPAFDEVQYRLRGVDNFLVEKIELITEWLDGRGKKIFPNPGCWTAAVAIAIDMPANIAPVLFILPRIEAWTMLFHEMTKPKL